jgi:uncharacterized protein
MQIFPNVKFHLDWKITILTVASTLVLIVDYYHHNLLSQWTSQFHKWNIPGILLTGAGRTFLYFIIPMFIIVVVFRESPKNYGFTFGDWKAGLIISISVIVLFTPVLWMVGRNVVSLQRYYKTMVTGLPWNTLFDLFGWEFFFRGWLFFGYARKFGTDALWLQAVPFALAHVGKPELETLSTIFGGFVFGWIAWRTRSFIYPLLIHWFIASFIIVVAANVL